jgi:NADH-quinone oxidoreductase subunit C
MSENKHTDGARPAPEGITSGDDTSGGTDSATAASVAGPAVHPGDDLIGNPEEVADETAPRTLPDNDVLRGLIELFEDATWSVSAGQDVVRVPAERFSEFGQAAKDAGFEVCVDVTAVDWFRARRIRYDVVANLLSHAHLLRLRVIAEVGGDEPTVPSLTPIWPGAGFAEREAYDMFGIVFEGHPDLTRILMPDDWVGFPLRKDFAVGSVPVQFKDSNKVR